MIVNYLKTAYRNMLKDKVQTLINIVGLSVGLACSLLIFLWVQSELSTDTWHESNDRLMVVYEKVYSQGKIEGNYGTSGLLASEIRNTIPEVQYATTVAYDKWHTFQFSEKIITLNGGYAGEEYFKMFSNKFLEGSSKDALSSLSGIAISHKMANQFFGSPRAAMNKSLRYDNKKNFFVKAVFEDLPSNTSKKFEYLTSWNQELNEHPWLKEWNIQGPQTYLMLRENADHSLVEKKITHFLNKYIKESKTYKIELALQPYSKVYLYGGFSNGKITGGRIAYVKVFILIAVFILVIACINFMNLMTARSIKRSKEVGVRKILGATKAVLIKQFLGESMLTTLVSVTVSLGLFVLFLPVFKEVTQKQLELPFGHFSFWILLIAIAFVTGLLSGAYPALFLSSFSAVKVLSGGVRMGRGATLFRKCLVVFQFALSLFLIIGTIVIARQINFIQSKSLGYDRNNLIYQPLTGDLKAKYDLFKNNTLTLPGIQSITHASEALTDVENSENDINWTNKDPNDKTQFTIIGAGYNFVSTLRLQLIEGRDFSKEFPKDSTGFLINEAALKEIGYKSPIGLSINLWGRKGQIIGVIKDFNFASLHDPIKPLIVRFCEYESMGTAIIRTHSGMTKQALESLRKVNQKLNPNFPLNYTFSEDEYDILYESEQMVGRLSSAFSLLAIFISCFGLLGQVMFTAEQRFREIGIRKLLGASVPSLLKLLSGDFLLYIIIALLIASPISYIVLNKWLQGFAFHTSIQLWIFGISAIVAIFITFITISIYTFKVAMMNPMNSIRS
ncbi:ABC transporter permease [Arcticibacter eurypsychrophilus]|uniref:ABC transporter permease n=1 Tax=Arcticibacter eurypsychrophilus TaxID=1434752 RepID=UPI00084D3025|nr:ABC transporter permease [Arcticibacter eurypsychrophilus]